MNKNKHTDLDGLIDLDRRSLIKLGNSAVVSIPRADDLGIIGNIEDLDAAVSVRLVDSNQIIIEARVDLSNVELGDIDLTLD
jgi:antitoxin component of MazEF toxin-antitoxin module